MNKKYKGIWFYGNAGTGKSIASKFLIKKIKNSILLDGDEIRKYVSFDLGYSIKDREIQIKRVFGICKIVKQSNIFPIASTVYMNAKIKKKLMDQNILPIKILRDFDKIKNRKNIYNHKMKHVIGKDLKNPNLRNQLEIINNQTIKKLYNKLSKIIL